MLVTGAYDNAFAFRVDVAVIKQNRALIHSTVLLSTLSNSLFYILRYPCKLTDFRVIFCNRTLHKQGVYGGHPTVKRTLIITPGSLVKVYFISRPI